MKRLTILLIILVAGATLVGCEQGLFSADLPRTQFERYDKMRGIFRPKETTDPQGLAVPDLRARLSVYQ